MTQYCLVEEGAITDGPRALPKVWRNVSGLDLASDASLKTKGWLPYVDDPPEYNEDTQVLSGINVVGEDVVTKAYTVVDYTEAEMAERIAEAKETKKAAIRQQANVRIMADYPLWYQSNCSLAIYPSETVSTMTSAITAIISASNAAEDSVDSATTLAQIRAVEPDWPEE